MSETDSSSGTASTQISELENNYKKGEEEKGNHSKEPNNVRSAKVITDTLCTLIKASESINGRLQTIQNVTSEISLFRQEVMEMNKKLDKLIELAERSPDGKSTFMKYLLS
jgi:hypothetical protein